MESRHFLKVRDTVEDIGGTVGRVVEGSALYARIEWADGGIVRERARIEAAVLDALGLPTSP